MTLHFKKRIKSRFLDFENVQKVYSNYVAYYVCLNGLRNE